MKKDYISKEGFLKLKKELTILLRKDRPEVLDIVSWAASNGDRSENGDYIYGKKKLREIDKRIRYLTKKIDSLIVVDIADQVGNQSIFFGATVEFMRNDSSTEQIVIVGSEETKHKKGFISWNSPIARALLNHKTGDIVRVETPNGNEKIKILSVAYNEFRE